MADAASKPGEAMLAVTCVAPAAEQAATPMLAILCETPAPGDAAGARLTSKSFSICAATSTDAPFALSPKLRSTQHVSLPDLDKC